MTNKIIKSNLFEVNVTKKTKWIFIKLENDIGVFGWGEATLQGKEKEIFRNSQRIFELILNNGNTITSGYKAPIMALGVLFEKCLSPLTAKLPPSPFQQFQ